MSKKKLINSKKVDNFGLPAKILSTSSKKLIIFSRKLIKSGKSISYQLFYCTYKFLPNVPTALGFCRKRLRYLASWERGEMPFALSDAALVPRCHIRAPAVHSFSNSVLLHARHRMRLCVRLLMAAREHHGPRAETQTTYPLLIAAWYLCHWQLSASSSMFP